MLPSLSLAGTALLAFLGMAQSSLAQGSDPSPQAAATKFLEQLRIDEITGDQGGVRVRASRIEPNERNVAGVLISCGQGRDRWYMAVQDHMLQTDDRWGVEPGFCDTLLAAARQRKDAQER
jgi:hypothetical protein